MADVPVEFPNPSTDVLRRLEVRPIRPEERAEWDALVDRHHYLGLRSLFGKTLRYVAAVEGRWLALLGWQAAALKCAPRDAWIGWPAVLHYQRLHLVANNARFLVLPWGRLPNLASRVLALNLRRLSGDWQQIHGHPLLLAETFVDTARFTGTCYRAANWQTVGSTRGFARHNGHYLAHGQPKAVLVYPLHAQARALLCARALPPAWSTPMQRVTLTTAQLEALQQRLRALPDCRHPRGQRHRLATVLSIAIAAVLAGSRGYSAIAEWAARLTQSQLQRLRARYNPRTRRFQAPSEPTIRRLLQSVDVAAVDTAFGDWLLGVAGKDAVAIDGKVVCGAVRADGTQVHLLSAFLQGQGITVAQREIPAKTNEIPEIKPLLQPLELTGQVVTADALHTQRETARVLVEDKHAHYLLTVKHNQPTLYEDLSALSEAHFPPQLGDPR
jgi:Druantia protein DruA/DDE_Tnp_1-associated